MSDNWAGSDPRTAALIQWITEQAQYGGGGGVTTPMDQLGFGYEPSAMQNANQYGLLPPVDAEGGSVEDMAKRANLMQDNADMMMDPYFAAQAGGGGFAADAFAPTVTYEVVPTPGIDAFNYYLTQPNTIEGLVAIGVLQQGLSASEVINRLRVRYETGTDEDKALIEQSVGAYMYPEEAGMPPVIHWNQVLERVLPLEQDYLRDPKPGQGGQVLDPDGNVVSSGGNYVMGADGQLLREIVEESPLAEHYHEAGLPLPTDTYTAESMMSPEWQQASEAYLGAAPGLETGLAATHAASDSAAQRWLDAQAQVAAGTLPPEGGEFARNQSDRDVMGMRSGVGTYEPARGDETGEGGTPMVEAVTGNAPIDLSGIDTMSEEELRRLWTANPGLPQDQLQQILDVSRRHEIADPQNYSQWAGLSADLADAISAPPNAVTEPQYEQYETAVEAGAAATTATGMPSGPVSTETLDDLLYSGETPDPTAVDNWLTTNWLRMGQGERQDALDQIVLREQELGLAVASNITDATAVAAYDAWKPIADHAQTLLDSGEIANWNVNVEGASPAPGGALAGAGGGNVVDLSGVMGGPGGGVPRSAPPNATPPQAPPFPDTGTQAAIGGMGGGMPAAAGPQAGSPEATLAMLQSLLPGWMTNSPMLPAVLNQAANGGQVAPSAGFNAQAVGTDALQGSIAALLRGLPGHAAPVPAAAGSVAENPATAQWVGNNPTTTPTGTLPTYTAIQGGGNEAAMRALVAQMLEGGRAGGQPAAPTGPQGTPPSYSVGTGPYPAQPTAPGQSNAVMSALLRSMMPGGMPMPQYSPTGTAPLAQSPGGAPPRQVNTGAGLQGQMQTYGQQAMLGQQQQAENFPRPTPGPPSNPTPLPTWMAGAQAPSTIQPSQPAGPTQGQGSEAMLLAMLRAAQGGMGAGIAEQGQPYTTSAQGQETASADAYNKAALQRSGRGQEMLETTGFNPQALSLSIAGGGREGGGERVGRTAPKITSRLQSQAAAATQQWLAEDRRIRQLHRAVYGGDYQRSRARSFYLQQRGITPLTQTLANRQGAIANMGLGY